MPGIDDQVPAPGVVRETHVVVVAVDPSAGAEPQRVERPVRSPGGAAEYVPGVVDRDEGQLGPGGRGR